MTEKAKKITSVFLALCFSATLFSAPVLAKKGDGNNKDKGKQQQNKGYDQGQKGKDKKDDRAKGNQRGNIVVNIMKSNWSDFDRARANRLTLDDFITASFIASQLGHNDFMYVFTMKKNGKPYKEICKANGIKWGWVRRNVKNQYAIMNDDAIKLGLVMWALDEIFD